MAKLHLLVEENDLGTSEQVPQWLLDCFTAVVELRAVPRTRYTYDRNEGDVANFVAELEDLIDADWDDYGEAVVAVFPALKMRVLMSTEGNFYEVQRLD